MANQLLLRHGVVTRDMAAVEQLPGGFSALYPVLRRLEETGRIRRGYFVAGLGAAQFAQPGAVDLLRSAREGPMTMPRLRCRPPTRQTPMASWFHGPLARGRNSRSAWRAMARHHRRSRRAGARVVLVNGQLAAWIGRGDRQLIVSLPADEPERSATAAHSRASWWDRAPRTRRTAGLVDRRDQRTAGPTDPATITCLKHGFAGNGHGTAVARPTATGRQQRRRCCHPSMCLESVAYA